ncbi:O-sialoglycoprotein endopeptidase [Burkholderiales bacterium]|nr:O-sialoglycoprotein endopeptidase [Burkholderiales bacterium]
MAPTIFAIDTAGEHCSLALSRGAGVETVFGEAGHTHLEHVMPMIERLFARCSLRPEQCDAFAYGSGPGSFTGLRVACTIVQGLALGTGKPVISVGNLAALACAGDAAAPRQTAGRGRRRALVATDARMQQAYWAVYEQAGGGWTELAPPALCGVNELSQMISDWQVDFCAGSASWLRPHMDAGGPALRDVSVDGAIIARLAQGKFALGEVLPPERALPAYVRDRVAQTVAERRGTGAGGQA